jgi:hypothetical protein
LKPTANAISKRSGREPLVLFSILEIKNLQTLWLSLKNQIRIKIKREERNRQKEQNWNKYLLLVLM